jgi:hypothetical protein
MKDEAKQIDGNGLAAGMACAVLNAAYPHPTSGKKLVKSAQALLTRYPQIEAIPSLVDAVNLALTLERADIQQLLKDGWKEDSMPLQACRNNILKYKAALQRAGIES